MRCHPTRGSPDHRAGMSTQLKKVSRLGKDSPDRAMRANGEWIDGTTDGDLPGLNRLPRSEEQERGPAEGLSR